MAARARSFTGSSVIAAADEADVVWGIAYTGFTSVVVYDGHDATGKIVAAGAAGPATIMLNFPVDCENGIYVATAGTGSGSVFV